MRFAPPPVDSVWTVAPLSSSSVAAAAASARKTPSPSHRVTHHRHRRIPSHHRFRLLILHLFAVHVMLHGSGHVQHADRESAARGYFV